MVMAQAPETKVVPQVASPAVPPVGAPETREDGNNIRLSYRLIECPDRSALAALKKTGDNTPNAKGQMDFGVQFLSAKEQANLLETVLGNKKAVMITAPKVTLVSGTNAKISIGSPSGEVIKRMGVEQLNLNTQATLQDGIILLESKGDFLYKDQSKHQWETTGKLKSGESLVFSGSGAGNPPILVIVTAETLP